MSENYLQYLSGYQKDNIKLSDVRKAINDIQRVDDEHGAFWVSVFSDDENVIEVSKDMNISIVFEGEEYKYHAESWAEVENLYTLLLDEKFEEIESVVTNWLV